MNPKLLVLPGLCLGAALLLLAPARPSAAFSKIGGSLNESQRDVRVHDNFLDATANDNLAPATQFPGWTGVEVAVWKAIVEWGSRPHGDGSGDPLSGSLGDGGANFDALWAGSADGVGTNNQNIASSLTSCGGGGTLAYCETPISDGWRIRFCDEWTWDDGPGNIGARFDIQGVMTHEFGHALGLGHSGNGQATMAPSVGMGQTTSRSIHTDDVAGIQCIYGVASVGKPVIAATVADPAAKSLTLYGSDFAAVDNEVWFTSSGVSAQNADPIVRVSGVASTVSGTRITLAIPPGAGPGDVMVNKPGSGGATLSNAYPTDLVGSFGIPPVPHPDIQDVTPSTIDALIPGTDQTITLSGEHLDLTTTLLLDGVPIPASRWAIVDPTLISLDMPQASSLGAHALGASDGLATDELGVTIVAPAQPRYELGTGDPLNVVDTSDGMSFILSGVPGRVMRVFASLSSVASTSSAFQLDIGNRFANLYYGGQYVIPPSGWLQVTIPSQALPDPGPAGTVFYSQAVEMRLPKPFDSSNLQSILMVQ